MPLDIHLHHYFPSDMVPAWASKLQTSVDLINRKLDTIMATLDEVLKDVTEETTQIDSMSLLIAGLKQQVADALAGATLTPAMQAKVDQIFATAESNKAKIVTALAANTPPAA